MKKIFGIFVPIIILVSVLGLLLFAYSNGRKGLGCNLNNEPGVEAGEKDSQLFIDAFEKYKSIHEKYPRNLDELGNIDLKGYSNPNITGISPYFASDDFYRITFTFKNDYVCPLGQARKCTYRSENKDWFCD